MEFLLSFEIVSVAWDIPLSLTFLLESPEERLQTLKTAVIRNSFSSSFQHKGEPSSDKNEPRYAPASPCTLLFILRGSSSTEVTRLSATAGP